MAKIVTDPAKIDELLTRGVEEAIVRDHLRAALLSGTRLRVKLGIDPTAPDLHLGHTVPLRKLRQFQDLGHTAVLIIGDFTAKIGDPSGRSEERKPLTDADIRRNMKKYLGHAGKVLNMKGIEVVYNGAWFKKEGLKEILELAGAGSIQQVLHRADFKKRLDAGHDVTLLEVFYSLFQGYDSVKTKADVELGGTDQKFNLLMGRRVQRHFSVSEQDVLTVPLLEGTDGVKKMSKSAGNYIALDADPDEMFGKIMAIPDEMIDKYYILLTPRERTVRDPREAKLELGETIVGIYHGERAGQAARERFVTVFSSKQIPDKVPLLRIGIREPSLTELLVKANLASSKSEARRLIVQGGVRVNGERVVDPGRTIILADETLLQVGRHRFLRVES